MLKAYFRLVQHHHQQGRSDQKDAPLQMGGHHGHRGKKAMQAET